MKKKLLKFTIIIFIILNGAFIVHANEKIILPEKKPVITKEQTSNKVAKYLIQTKKPNINTKKNKIKKKKKKKEKKTKKTKKIKKKIKSFEKGIKISTNIQNRKTPFYQKINLTILRKGRSHLFPHFYPHIYNFA